MPKAKKRPKPVVARHIKGERFGPLQGVSKQNGRHKQHASRAVTPADQQEPRQTDKRQHPGKAAAARSSGDGPVRKIKAHKSCEDSTAVLRCTQVAARQAASAVKCLVAGDAQSATLLHHTVYFILLEVIKQAGLVESISGLPAGSVPEATNIPVANSSGGPPTKVRSMYALRLGITGMRLPARTALHYIPAVKVICPYNMLVIVYELLLGQ
eukprot:scaffold150607_cov17-Tisochrysis_lutea.AAC.2